MSAVLPSWLFARVLVVVASLLARVSTKWLVGHPFTANVHGPLGWVSWDGSWYETIARGGYGHLGKESLRFFPLFPMLGKALGWVLGGNTQLALLALANVGALGAGLLLHRLVLDETGDRAAASRSVWYLALFPSAFVLAWAYAESLFLCAAIGAFIGYRRGRWWWAALAGLAAGLLRPVGCLLAIPAVVEVVRTRGRGRKLVSTDQAAAVLAPVAGLIAYLAWVGVRFGDWFAPYTVQEGLRGKTVDPITRLVDGVKQLGGSQGLKQGLHVPFAVIFVVLVLVVLWRWPVSYGLFAAAVLVVALGSANINSLERYALGGFPIVLGLVTISGDDRVDRIVTAGSAATMVALASLALVGAYVP
ncbi:MAG TPA: hypothetical protein VHA73_05735 [Acidimicrobiales bacterium]|nr:hypothetical protein [Acidimicrobiales bacterium]